MLKVDDGLTGNRRYLMHLLGMDEEHDITLGQVDIGILEQKHPIYAVLLEDRKLDEESDWASQVFANDQILLTPDLHAQLAGVD